MNGKMMHEDSNETKVSSTDEKITRPLDDLMKRVYHRYHSSRISKKKWRLILCWTYNICREWQISNEIYFSSISILYLFLNKNGNINEDNVQLYNLSCLMLATQLKDCEEITLDEICLASDNIYGCSEIVAAQKLILETLNNQIIVSTPYTFFKTATTEQGTQDEVVESLMIIAVFGRWHYYPDVIASASIFLYLKYFESNDEIDKVAILGYSYSQVELVIYRIIHYIQRFIKSRIYTVMNIENKFDKIANIFSNCSLELSSYQKGFDESLIVPKLKNSIKDPFRMQTSHQSFETLRLMGHGTYGRVYLQSSTKLSEFVATKVQPYASQGNILSITLREIAILSTYTHPNLVNLIDVRYTDECVMMMMKIETSDLLSIIYIGDNWKRRSSLWSRIMIDGEDPNKLYTQNLSLKLRRKLGNDLVAGLKFLRSVGILHRDIKPNNLLVTNDTLKIADFGSSEPMIVCNKCKYRSRIIAVSYRPPELHMLAAKSPLQFECQYGYEVDIWAAGCTLLEMELGVIPFGSSDVLDNILKVMGNPDKLFMIKDSGLRNALNRMLSLAPEIREYPEELL